MAPASSNSMFQFLRRSAARPLAFGDSCGLRDSGRTATLIGARRGSRRITVRFSMTPLALGASSSLYASSMKASMARLTPAAGSMTYGV